MKQYMATLVLMVTLGNIWIIFGYLVTLGAADGLFVLLVLLTKLVTLGGAVA